VNDPPGELIALISFFSFSKELPVLTTIRFVFFSRSHCPSDLFSTHIPRFFLLGSFSRAIVVFRFAEGGMSRPSPGRRSAIAPPPPPFRGSGAVSQGTGLVTSPSPSSSFPFVNAFPLLHSWDSRSLLSGGRDSPLCFSPPQTSFLLLSLAFGGAAA